MVSALSVVVHSQLLLRSQDWPPHLQSRTEGLKPPVTRLTSHLRGYLPGMAPATTNVTNYYRQNMNPIKQIIVAHAVPVAVSRVMTSIDEYKFLIEGSQSQEQVMLSEAELMAKYLPVGDISHLPEFLQRVHIERAQLAHRVSKLTAYISTAGFLELHDNDRHLLEHQLDAMSAYRRILDERIDNHAGKLLEKLA